jgi:hypothetical protein
MQRENVLGDDWISLLQQQFLGCLHDVDVLDDTYWLLVGDFNLIRRLNDRNKLGGYVGPFGLGDWTFDSHMIDLLVIVHLLPLVVEVGIGASGDGEDCAMGVNIVGLLCRLTDL